ncbi:transposase [Pseudomonas sp. GD03944]|uniref:REP-associated tyrosine transposase n=1 Tax=Pseudomonas sp. GD03944 TaxID=2975409 RepID=UPI0024470675|nr:transposase [Pseudomonas sp. GD03944]MDH1263072.1 transposase [Pseudomonas sp. GD03944]
MPQTPPAWVPGGTYFFTVSLSDRGSDLLTRHIDLLRRATDLTRLQHPLRINAWVVLPDHMHCLWTLPQGDNDPDCRWTLLKHQFTRHLPLRATFGRRRRLGVWQRHHEQHRIRDAEDFRRHYDAIHLDPVKHGWARRVGDWPHSSFHHAVRAGIYPPDWPGEAGFDLE